MTEQTSQDATSSSNQSEGRADDRDGFVKYETYSRAIGEVKDYKQRFRDTQAELNVFREKEKAVQEAKLLEEKEYQKVIESLKAEKDQLANRVMEHEKNETDFRKMNAAMSLMQQKGISLEAKYMGLVPIDAIEMTEDGGVDLTSVASVVDNFQKEHPRLTMPASKILPNDRSSSANMISKEEWHKLSTKDKKQALLDKRVKL